MPGGDFAKGAACCQAGSPPDLLRWNKRLGGYRIYLLKIRPGDMPWPVENVRSWLRLPAAVLGQDAPATVISNRRRYNFSKCC